MELTFAGLMYQGHLNLLSKIRESGVVMNNSLSFVNDWVYFTQDPTQDFEQLTKTGPYAGTLQAFTTGVKLRSRYQHLLPQNTVKLWASDSGRVIETARYFATGLFGIGWDRNGKANLEIIPETGDIGANTLTPGETCSRYVEDLEFGHDYGASVLEKFQQKYIPNIISRLAADNPSIRFTNSEVFSMQEMCGFETIIRGSSPWCSIFHRDEWEHFEYARDLVHYFRAGPGNPYAPAMGWLWLNATTELLHEPSKLGQLFFSL